MFMLLMNSKPLAGIPARNSYLDLDKLPYASTIIDTQKHKRIMLKY